MSKDEILELHFAGWAKTHEVLEFISMKEYKKIRSQELPQNKYVRKIRRKRDYIFDKLF